MTFLRAAIRADRVVLHVGTQNRKTSRLRSQSLSCTGLLACLRQTSQSDQRLAHGFIERRRGKRIAKKSPEFAPSIEIDSRQT